MKAMILAAGRGERMRPLTDMTPKPLLQAGGKALIEHHIEHLAAAGFQEIVINYAYLGEQIKQYLGDGSDYHVCIRYSPEKTALETGGGVFQALPLLGDKPFAIVNADVWTDYPFANLARQTSGASLVHLVMADNPTHHPSGDFGLYKGMLTLQPPLLTYTGVGVYSPALFAGHRAGKFPLAPLIQNAIAAGQATGEHYLGQWRDIGTPSQLQALNEYLGPKRYQPKKFLA